MRFIANVTSERATKELAGREFLYIKFSNEKGVVCRIDMKDKDGTPYLEIWDATGSTTKTIHHPLHISRSRDMRTGGECTICDAPLGLDKKCPYGC